jgi:hypothetical protein
MRRQVSVAAIAIGHPVMAAAIGHFDRKRPARARHARDKPGRLQDGFRDLIGKFLLRRIIKMAPEECKPRSQTNARARRGNAEQFILVKHDLFRRSHLSD